MRAGKGFWVAGVNHDSLLPRTGRLTIPAKAVTDTEKQVGFGLVFPTSVLPHLWLFRTIGGWRGLNTLIVEASTGYPTDLREAIKGGHCGVRSSATCLKLKG
jgi:hypothetical protein